MWKIDREFVKKNHIWKSNYKMDWTSYFVLPRLGNLKWVYMSLLKRFEITSEFKALLYQCYNKFSTINEWTNRQLMKSKQNKNHR
jgi:hypothetical protein